MPQFNELKKLEPLIKKCVLCGGCHAGCPTYDLSRMEHDSARGKVLLADAILKGELKLDHNLAEKFDHCLTCMNCVETCPAGADPVKVITAARSELRNNVNGHFISDQLFSKVLPSKKLFSIFSKVVALATKLFKLMPPINGLPFVKSFKKKTLPNFSFQTLKNSYPEIVKVDNPFLKVGFFTGCMANSVANDAGKEVIEILGKAGVEVHLLKDEVCCGAPAFFAGDRESAKEMAEKNISAFGEKELDYIVTSCATCGSTLKEIYPELMGGEKTAQFSPKIIDFQSLLMEKLWLRLSFKTADKPIKVTYHDPCHLSRGMKVVDQPREILKRLPGIEFAEMLDASLCCGGAGSFGMKYYEDSLEIGKRKAEAIIGSGADIVATACPSCRMQLTELANRFAPEVKVEHTASIVRKLLK